MIWKILFLIYLAVTTVLMLTISWKMRGRHGPLPRPIRHIVIVFTGVGIVLAMGSLIG